jgi:hypothetical protein
MSWLISTLALLTGLSVRLAIPIAITVLLVHLLRGLDARWQIEAEQIPAGGPKPRCWELKTCPPEKHWACPAFQSEEACWQVFRRPNGYLREGCLTCIVFLRAPLQQMQPKSV